MMSVQLLYHGLQIIARAFLPSIASKSDVAIFNELSTSALISGLIMAPPDRQKRQNR